MRRLGIIELCAVAGVLTTTGISAADEISTIALSDAGPDQNIPTDHSFYVAGDAGKNTIAVQAVIARKGSPAMFGSDGPTCSRLAELLHIDRVAATPLDAGVHNAFKLFPSAAPDVRDGNVLVSARWTRPATGDAPAYKVLVPTDETFFGPGYSYCLYVLKQTQKVDDVTILAAIDKVVTELDRCAARDDVAKAANETAATPAIAACRARAQQRFDSAIDKLLDSALLVVASGARAKPSCAGGKPPGKKPSDRDSAYCALADAVTVALGLAETVYLKRTALDVALAATTGADLPRGWLSTSGDNADLGRAVVTMLTSQGSLFPFRTQETKPGSALREITATRSATVEHVTRDGQIAVAYVSILDDDLHIRVASSDAPTAAQTRVLDGVTTDDLAVASGVTLHDLLLLRRGVIHAAADTTLTELRAAVRKVALRPAWTAGERVYFEAVRDRIGRMFELASGPTPATLEEETPAAVRVHIKNWLVRDAVLPASVRMVADNLKTLVAQKLAFDAATDNLTFVASAQSQLGGPQPIPFHIGFDQKTWLFSYVTPTVGYAQIDSHDGWFSTLYFAAQIHLFPNPVDDPMWRHGVARDLKRSFALELGLGSNLSSFGPDNRYRGVFGLPAPFVAIAVHPLPYTSVSFGEALVERRSSVLSVESPHWAPSFFIGLNVQLNVPDLIRSQKPSTPSVESSTGNH
jgi:hypothetical protein